MSAVKQVVIKADAASPFVREEGGEEREREREREYKGEGEREEIDERRKRKT